MAWLALLLASFSAAGLVNVAKVAPTVVVDMRYATPNNFAKTPFYPAAACFLDEKAAGALKRVEADLAPSGLRLKVFDCYRPLSVQRKLWKLVPDPRYVADPSKGSRHNRGMAVDLTLVGRDGRELTMPTGFDDFTDRAHRDSPASPEAAKNRALLEKAMSKRGFVGLSTEWWHFDYSEWDKAPLLDVSFATLLKTSQ